MATYDKATYEVVGGLCGAQALRVEIMTDNCGIVIIHIYIANFKELEMTGVDAAQLTLDDVDLGNFETYFDEATKSSSFRASLPRKGEYLYLIAPAEVKQDYKIYYSNEFKTKEGRDGQALLYPCDGDQYFKVTEALSYDEEVEGIGLKKHYKCVTVKSEEGRLMNLEEEGDKDLVTLVSSIEVELEEEDVCRGMHKVALVESDIDAIQHTPVVETEPESKEHRLTFRVYCKTL